MDLVKSWHNVGESCFHLQFTPAYRRSIFARSEVRELVRTYFFVKAEKLGVNIRALEFGPDHVHLFVMDCRRYSVTKLVNEFKGFTSRMMRKHHWTLFCDMLWKDKFWNAGYFYRSIGSVTSEAIEHYINESQTKHW